jgi:hypothetical protein
MILGFSTVFPWGWPTNFQEKILSGRKIHTIRKGARWSVGDRIHFSTGVRSKRYNCFALGEVTKVRLIQIYPITKKVAIETFEGGVFKAGMVLTRELVIEEFAKNDGFDTVEDFWKWFKEPFRGQLIYWKLVDKIDR